MKYTSTFGSKFPEQILANKITFKDVKNDEIGKLINSIKNAQLKGNYADAQKTIDANMDTLRPYMLSAEYINFLDEETRNIEIYSKGKQQTHFYQSAAPVEYSEINDVWIGG